MERRGWEKFIKEEKEKRRQGLTRKKETVYRDVDRKAYLHLIIISDLKGDATKSGTTISWEGAKNHRGEGDHAGGCDRRYKKRKKGHLRGGEVQLHMKRKRR